MRTMVHPCCWFLQLILLCQLFQLGTPLYGGAQYSSLGIYQEEYISSEDKGEIVVFLLFIVLDKIGKRLDRGYRCPLYCEVDHKHYYWENDEEKSNISRDDELPGSSTPENREQQEVVLRTGPDVH